MVESGIVAQYGFLYQRKAFMLCAMQNVSVNQLFLFEGKDDIEISADEKIYTIEAFSGSCIQVKSGYVSEDCFSKVICNWLLVDSEQDYTFELILENDLPFDYSSKDRAKEIHEFIENGKSKKKSSIARKTYDKYVTTLSSRTDSILEKIEKLICSFRKTVYSIEKIDALLLERFSENYCADIHNYDIAKAKRLERFLSYINSGIDIAIKNKKPYRLLYPDFIKLVVQVTEEISDRKYTIDIKYLKKKSESIAQQIVKERTSREVKQLYLVDSEESFVVDGIVHELIYKDFRSVYEQQREVDISNWEQNARENYEAARFSLKGGLDDPRNLYIKTNEHPIESDLLPKGMIYRKGCYIYLTGDSIDEDIQIMWGEDNDDK